MPKPINYTWLDDNSYAKLKGQTKMLVSNVMHDFRSYGMSPMVDGAIDTLMDIVEQSWQKVRGKDIPYTVKVTRYFDNE